MFPKPQAALSPNTYAYESEPMVKATGFREYDARWLFGKEINLMGVQALGLGLGTLIHELGAKPELVTAHDFRGYSASIKMALVTGLMTAGIKVKDIGLAVTAGRRNDDFELRHGCDLSPTATAAIRDPRVSGRRVIDGLRALARKYAQLTSPR